MAENPSVLRELANWYRKFAERAGSPWVWEARLLTADRLDAEADHIERGLLSRLQDLSPMLVPVRARRRESPSGAMGE